MPRLRFLRPSTGLGLEKRGIYPRIWSFIGRFLYLCLFAWLLLALISASYTLSEKLSHFSTVSYNVRHRFTQETIEAVFRWILEEAGSAGTLTPAAVFIDGTHIKACANLNKKINWQRSTQTEKPMRKSPSMMTMILLRPPKRGGTTPPKRSWRDGRRQVSKL